MKYAKRILPIVIIMLFSLCLSTSCMLTGDNFKVRDLISYINENKEGDEKFTGANIYDEHVQKSINIVFTNVDTVKEADEIIRLINQYLDGHPEYFLNDNYYIDVDMNKFRSTYSYNFSCTNSMENYSVEDERHYDKTVAIEEDLCRLIVNGLSMDGEELKISRYSALFSDIKLLDLSDNVVIDDLSVFGTFESLEIVRFDNHEGQISDETLAQLKDSYPEIEFH